MEVGNAVKAEPVNADDGNLGYYFVFGIIFLVRNKTNLPGWPKPHGSAFAAMPVPCGVPPAHPPSLLPSSFCLATLLWPHRMGKDWPSLWMNQRQMDRLRRLAPQPLLRSLKHRSALLSSSPFAADALPFLLRFPFALRRLRRFSAAPFSAVSPRMSTDGRAPPLPHQQRMAASEQQPNLDLCGEWWMKKCRGDRAKCANY